VYAARIIFFGALQKNFPISSTRRISRNSITAAHVFGAMSPFFVRDDGIPKSKQPPVDFSFLVIAPKGVGGA
jgi:hypothetical protein